MSSTASEMLVSFRDRIARLEDEKAQLAADVKDLYAEAKAAGLDPKALKIIVKEYRKTEDQRAADRATEEMADIYRSDLGMIPEDEPAPPREPAPRSKRQAVQNADDEAARALEASRVIREFYGRVDVDPPARCVGDEQAGKSRGPGGSTHAGAH